MSNVKLAVGREADESNYSIGKSSNMRRIKKENSVFQTILGKLVNVCYFVKCLIAVILFNQIHL